jgi:glycerophosphoryl diester phosphodiesterase
MQWRPAVVAHRGNLAGPGVAHAENSIQAFLESHSRGFPSECDVHLTADGEVVVIHDQTLDRTTLATGDVSDFTAAQLGQISLRTPKGDFAPIPLLREVADLVWLVEIKPPDSRELVQRVIQIMSRRTWLLQSFDARNLLHAKAIDPSLPLAFLIEDDKEIDFAIRMHWRVHLDYQLLNDRTASLLSSAGLPTGVWTVNDQSSLRRISKYRPDVVITDVPLLMQRWLAELPL